MNLLTCFVRTSRQEELNKILQQFCGIDSVISNAPVPAPTMEILADPDTLPTLFIENRHDQWLVIEVNSVKKLHELGRMISLILQTHFIQIIYCALVEYAYFLMYDEGQAIREIEGNGSQEDPVCDKGDKLPFEEEQVRYFDLDMLAYYCQQLGLDLSNMVEETVCTILTTSADHPTIRLDHPTSLRHLLYPVR